MDPKAAEMLRLAWEALQSEQPDGEVVTKDGTRVTVAKNPAPGVSVRIEPVDRSDESLMTFTNYEPCQHRPEGYPAELPFASNIAVGIAERMDGKGTYACWQDVADASAIADQMVRDSLDAGWKRSGEYNVPGIVLSRGNVSRWIMVMPQRTAAMIILMELHSKL